MNLTLPPLDLDAGTIICLHIPHGFEEAAESLERSLLEVARQKRKSAEISRPAELARGVKRLFQNQTSASWLARAAGISSEESGRIIADLGVIVGKDLAHTAGTPCCLLGLAATMTRKPQVVAYSTTALDVEGCRTVHRFVASKFAQMCSVHISYPSVYGDGSPHPRQCPPAARCIELVAEPQCK